MVRSLLLYEPGYMGGDGLADLEGFMLLLGLQAGLSEHRRMPADLDEALSAQYSRLTKLVIATAADLRGEHFPSPDDSSRA